MNLKSTTRPWSSAHHAKDSKDDCGPMDLGFEDCDQYASDLMRAKESLLDLESSGVAALNPRRLPSPPDNPEEVLRAVIEQTQREIADYRRQLTECAKRYLAEKGWW